VGDGLVGVSAPRRDALARAVLWPSWLAVVAVAAASPLLPALPPAVRYAPFLLSVVVLGLPHGAVDHLVPGRLREGVSLRSVAAVVGVYLLLGGAYGVWWFLAPVSAFVAFVLLTWGHWGQGDVYALLAFAGVEHLPTRAERALAAFVRGGLPMGVPLVTHPEAYRRVAAAVVGLFDPAATAPLAPYVGDAARVAVGGGLLAATLLGAGLGARRVRRGADRRAWLVDMGEVALLWAFFALVPPILAVGLYFTAWHSLRHVGRLLAVDPTAAAALAAGDVRAAFGRFARDATPLTVAALGVFGGLAVLVPGSLAGREALLGLYLAGIAVVTLPHVAVVTYMDRVQGVW
jgi:Brp/Blh family beta-carotene 15,15'-monooxygenase